MRARLNDMIRASWMDLYDNSGNSGDGGDSGDGDGRNSGGGYIKTGVKQLVSERFQLLIE
jgi:hypothetical protein